MHGPVQAISIKLIGICSHERRGSAASGPNRRAGGTGSVRQDDPWCRSNGPDGPSDIHQANWDWFPRRGSAAGGPNRSGSGAAANGPGKPPKPLYGPTHWLARTVKLDNKFHGYSHLFLSRIYGYGSEDGGRDRLIIKDGGKDRSAFSVQEGCGGTYKLIVEDGGRDDSAVNVQEGRGSTYRLIIEDGGRDRSAFSVQEGCGSTYKLIVEDGGRDRSAFSVQEGYSSIYILIVEDGGRDRSAFSMQEGRGSTYSLIVEDRGMDRRRDRSTFSVQEGCSGTYSLIVEDGWRDWLASSAQEGCGGTYNLIVEDGGRDRSAFSVQEGRSGTYRLIIEDGGRHRLFVDDGRRARSALSVQEGRGSTYSLIVEDGGMDRSAFSVQEGHGSTYSLIVEDAGMDRSAFRVQEGHGGTDPPQTPLMQQAEQQLWFSSRLTISSFSIKRNQLEIVAESTLFSYVLQCAPSIAKRYNEEREGKNLSKTPCGFVAIFIALVTTKARRHSDNCKRGITASTKGQAEFGWIAPKPYSNGGHEREVDGTESKDRLLRDKAPDALGDVPDALGDARTLSPDTSSCAIGGSLIPSQQLPERFKESVTPFAPVCSSGLVIALASMVDIENKPNPRACVVHPAKIQDDSGMLVSRNLSIPEMHDDGLEACKILCIDGCANANARDIWVGGDSAWVDGHGGGNKEVCWRHPERQRTPHVFHPTAPGWDRQDEYY
ncbi:hypothetical protein C8J57DRAFT_1238900 [Mycena rebaudengoi]|nr:hypothetical protein C8J57DRAFT_1238900 [Mycena rebaudengoi]